MNCKLFRLASDFAQGSLHGGAVIDAEVNTSTFHHPAILSPIGSPSYWVSPIVDTGDNRSSFFSAEWFQSATSGSGNITIETGNTPTPDDSWSLTTISSVAPADDAKYTVAGLSAAKAGRYARFTFRLAPSTDSAPSFVRDIAVYYWVKESDLSLQTLTPEGATQPGALMTAFVGALTTVAASTKARAVDFLDGTAINGMLDAQLKRATNDFNFSWPTNMPSEACRRCLLAKLQSRGTGNDGRVFIQSQVGLFLGVDPTTVIVSGSSSLSPAIIIPDPLGSFYPGLPGVQISDVPQLVSDCFALPADVAGGVICLPDADAPGRDVTDDFGLTLTDFGSGGCITAETLPAPIQVTPGDTYSGWYADQVFRWSVVTYPLSDTYAHEVASTYHYDIQVDASPSFTFPIFTSSGVFTNRGWSPFRIMEFGHPQNIGVLTKANYWLVPGTYYWRVRATSPDIIGDWSAVFSFTVIPAVPAAGLSLITLISPSDGATVSCPVTLHVNLNGNYGADYFMADDALMTVNVQSLGSTGDDTLMIYYEDPDTGIVSTDLPAGTYYWTALGPTIDPTTGIFAANIGSAVFSFTVA